MPRLTSPFIVEIEGFDPSDDGAAYTTVDGRRLRVDLAIPGERVEVRLPERAGPNTVGEAVRILQPSPHRVTPGCPYFGPCGGCTWQHIAWAEQLRLKERALQALLNLALAGAAPRVQPTIPGAVARRTIIAAERAEGPDAPDAPWRFRNKVHFLLAPASPRGGVVLGHYRRRSQAVVHVDACPVHADEGNRVAFAARDALARSRVNGASADGRRGLARHIVVRATETPPETLATLVVTRNDRVLRAAARTLVGAAAPDGLHLNVNDRPGPFLFGDETRRLHGRDRVRETIAGISFLISPTAFFQTNVQAAAAMVACVLDHAGAAATVVDLYAGAGLFSLPLASRGARVTAVEESPQAVEDGEASRRFNRIADSACRFIRARVEDVAGGRVRHPLPASPDLVIVDPPRSGCPPGVLKWICGTLQPSRVIYVSCNPQALAADLRLPLSGGYAAEPVQPVDMFPHTAHIESVAVLVRKM